MQRVAPAAVSLIFSWLVLAGMVHAGPLATAGGVAELPPLPQPSRSSVWLGPPAVDSHGHPGHIHSVVRGDTLWAISDAYLKTPWAWPSIWNENTGIANPHRIWPGDRIWISEYEMRRITREEADAMLAAAQERSSRQFRNGAGTGEPAVAGGLPETPRPGRRAIDARSLLDSVGFVSAATLAAAASIVDSPEPRIWLAGRDRVYLGLGMGEVAVGDRLSVFRHVEPIRDLRTRRLLGHHVGILGWLEVVEVQGDSSVAAIQVSVAEMARGDHVTPREVWPEPILPAPTASVVAGQIVFLPAPRSVMGTADSVYIDRGSNHGLRVGSELEIVEGGRAVVDSVRRSSVRTPTRVIGGLVVLATQPESALAVVTYVRRELELGDAVRSPPPEELAGR